MKSLLGMLLTEFSSRRLSIDIDIICPPGTDIEKYWGMYAKDRTGRREEQRQLVGPDNPKVGGSSPPSAIWPTG